jgi:hypothetical protein
MPGSPRSRSLLESSMCLTLLCPRSLPCAHCTKDIQQMPDG